VGSELAAAELRQQPENILHIAQQALQHLPSANREVRLLLNPLDFAVLNAPTSRSLEECGWRLLADPQVNRGGCRILLDSSEIDAGFHARVAAITDALFAEAPPMPSGDVTAELAAERGEL